MGVMKVYDALKKAEELGLDLVEVAPNSSPPVCRIMDFNKYKYEQRKKQKEAKKHQRHNQLKEIRFKPRIDKHDLEVKVNHIKEFLQDGHKVKVTVMFRGREMAYKEAGEELLDRVFEGLLGIAHIDREKRMEGRNLSLILSPGSSKKPGKKKGETNAEGKDA